MIFAFYGRRGSGKDTAANLFRLAILCRAGQYRSERMRVFTHDKLASYLRGSNQSNLLDWLNWKIYDNNPALGDWIITTSFSAKIHEMASLLTDVPLEMCLDRRFKDTLVPVGFEKTIREIMIDIGEGLRASYGPDVWIIPVLKSISEDPYKVFLIPGMRHANEYAAIKPLGAKFIKVQSDFEEVAGANEAEGLLEDHEFNLVLHNVKYDLTKMWLPIVDMVFSMDENLFKV